MKNFQSKDIDALLYKNYNLSDKKYQMLLGPENSLKRKLIISNEKTSGFKVDINNSCKIYFSGKEKFISLKKEIKNAKKYIHLEYYQIRSDSLGNEIKDLLIEKAKEGVEVKILYDFIGSFMHISRKFKKELKQANVEIKAFFNPFELFSYHKLNYRNHRKIAIIDGKKAYIGGINIGNEYINKGKRFKNWRDIHLMVEGDIVMQIQKIFLYDWFLTTKQNITNKKYFLHEKIDGHDTKNNEKNNLKNSNKFLYEANEGTPLQTIFSGPESKWESIKQAFFLMISNAKKTIHITTPYFIPDSSLFVALKNAALSNVNVKIIVPSKPDHISPFFASRTYFQELMEAGVEFYEYQNGFIHSKIISVDSEVATVGTANFDIRSLNVNFESNIMLYGEKEVLQIEKYFNESLKESKKINLDEFKRRSVFIKAIESFYRLFSHIL